MIYALKEQLAETDYEQLETEQCNAVMVFTPKEAGEMLQRIGAGVESEMTLREISFNKVEAEQEYFSGTLAVPRFLDVLGSRYRIAFYVTRKWIILINEDGYAEDLLNRLRRKYIRPEQTIEKFISMLFSEIISKDAVLLDQYEQVLMQMEDEALHKEPQDFIGRMLDVRKKLLTLRGYYEQIAEIGKTLEENENGIFHRKQLKYFGTVSDRAERLLQRAIHLIDYANQVKDVYQGQVDARQNRNMQYLTVVSTIFFPLTLITGWYGMNFEDMPELENGYPVIIGVSILVVIVCIIIFRKKKII